jgi:hypothetical protein
MSRGILGGNREGETILIIHDDTDADAVTKEAVSAIREIAGHIGKADRRYDEGQLVEIEKAIRELQAALTSKRRTNAHRI